MLKIMLWIGFIPVLYIVYYSDMRNERNFPDEESYKYRVGAFLAAVTGPIGLALYLVIGVLAFIWNILKTGQVVNSFKIFPCHSPWKHK